VGHRGSKEFNATLSASLGSHRWRYAGDRARKGQDTGNGADPNSLTWQAAFALTASVAVYGEGISVRRVARNAALIRFLERVYSWPIYRRWIWPFICWVSCRVWDRRPSYEPQRWNDPYKSGYSYGHQSENNCYNCACNKATDSYAQPGYAHGAVWTLLDCPNVSTAAAADGSRRSLRWCRRRTMLPHCRPQWRLAPTTTGIVSTLTVCGRTSPAGCPHGTPTSRRISSLTRGLQTVAPTRSSNWTSSPEGPIPDGRLPMIGFETSKTAFATSLRASPENRRGLDTEGFC
jgi:hypothetical protein